ncbi:MAG: T9SS type A sorting domain-containing protein [Flavobacteriales bacterium]|nr:T9SS type A sorting domain-containing protein [Flavobacteriales bacterium]
MKKIKYILAIVVALSTQIAWSQGDWQFVGPRSENQAADNKFETSQLNNITIDPYNQLHMFASGWYGGLWESMDRGTTWTNVDILPMNTNGVSAVTFVSSAEVIVGDLFQNSRYGDNYDEYRLYSKAVYKYNFQTKVWTSLGELENTGNVPFCIKSIAAFPVNHQILFVCTSRGLFHSMNGGQSWSAVPTAQDWVENMLFIPNVPSGGYNAYIAGSTGYGVHVYTDLFPTGTPMIKECTNAGALSPTFTNLSSNFSTPYSLSVARLCMAPMEASGDVQFFTLTLGSNASNFSSGTSYIHSFKKNMTTGVLSAYANLTPNSYVGHGSPTRMAVAYDNINKGVWFGGVYFNFLHVPSSKITATIFHRYHTRWGYLHDDYHDIVIDTYNGTTEMYLANDAGIAKSVLGSPFINGVPPNAPVAGQLYFEPMNYGIDVALVRGFSGSEHDPDIYAVGGHDIVNSDIYDAATGKNRYTHETWENDGTLIDKYDKDRMFLDATVWNAMYHVSLDGGQTIGSAKKFYRPAPGNTFEQGAVEGDDGGGGFRYRQFYQDPYRPGRIFHAKSKKGISQFDPVSNTFILKIEPWLMQPGLIWGPSCYTGAWEIKSEGLVKGMSFSPETPNSLHILINGDQGGDGCPATPSVIKYIGNNLDDCWNFHNLDAYTDATGTHPQWENITPVWANLGITSVEDVRGIDFVEIATSPWNKNVVYVMLNVPHHPEIFVLRYDGANWTNYSTGLPPDELGYSMIMDYQTNDGLYLATNKHVYYRTAHWADQWTLFSTGMPTVPAVQLEVNYATNSLRAGTYGRGIWKSGLKCPDLSSMDFTSSNNPIVPGYILAMKFTATNTSIAPGKTIFRAAESIILNPNFIADASTGAMFLGYIHGCSGPGNSYEVKPNNMLEVIQNVDDEEEEEEGVLIMPNPSNGVFTLSFMEQDEKNVVIYDMKGSAVFSMNECVQNTLEVDISDKPAGLYIVKIQIEDRLVTKKVIVR